ncbi:MAG: cytochrome b561 domain-containing protein [Paracoccaceae bacterium]
MWEWLFSSLDAAEPLDITVAVAWHGRTMVLAWGILSPVAVIAARYFKVLPGQDWPRELDSQIWWRSHWMGQLFVLGLSVFGLALVLPMNLSVLSLHGVLGCLVLAALAMQIALGVFRGSKGGPTAPAPDGSLRGDHYDMTPRRRWFEILHKTIGYSLLALASATMFLGLVLANGPNWMWLSIVVWWAILLGFCGYYQRKGMAVSSYRAIWGDDPKHPGNVSGSNEIDNKLGDQPSSV